jgi:phage baseplate assembly protein gpV
LGAVYNENTTPSSSGEDIVSVVFSNGDSVEYDRATGEMSITVSGGLTINGDVTVIGSLDASIDVTAGVFNTSLSTHTHPYVNVSAPATTSPPTP